VDVRRNFGRKMEYGNVSSGKCHRLRKVGKGHELDS